MQKTTATKPEAGERSDGTRFQSLNTVVLAGRLAADPTLRDTSAGQVTVLRVATNDSSKPEFHDVVSWGVYAAARIQHLGKGDPVRIEGRLRTRTWVAADGSCRRSTEIVASLVEPLGLGDN